MERGYTNTNMYTNLSLGVCMEEGKKKEEQRAKARGRKKGG
jgi:hypothetical protein